MISGIRLVSQADIIYQYNFGRKLIPYRSKIGSGHFERLDILEIFQDSYCMYKDLTIKSKFLKNIFLLSYLQLFYSQLSYLQYILQLKRALKTDLRWSETK